MPEPKTADATFVSTLDLSATPAVKAVAFAATSDTGTLHLFVYREDNDGKRINAGGHLYHEMRINCPHCGDSNLLVRWVDLGGIDMAGDLTCNKCGKAMVKKDADKVEVDIDLPERELEAKAKAMDAVVVQGSMTESAQAAVKDGETKTLSGGTLEAKDADKKPGDAGAQAS